MNDSSTSGQPYDVYAKLEDPMGVLSIALGQWERRDDSKPQPEVRRAANKAMDAIDTMLGELHAMRSRFVGEIRDADDATAARVDALLRQPEPDLRLALARRAVRKVEAESRASTSGKRGVDPEATHQARYAEFLAGVVAAGEAPGTP